MSGDNIAVKAYGGLTRLLSPFLPLLLKRRAAKGKEDPKRIPERLGHASVPRPHGHLVWLHGASVGETTMLLPLIERILEEPKTHVLLTSGTVTSAELMAQRLPDRAIHQFAPLDSPRAVKRFLRHWSPDVALWAESEIWPNMMRYTRRYGTPAALINARMSDQSLWRWRKNGLKNARSVFSNFNLILAANETTASGLSTILERPVPLIGNLKNAAPALPAAKAALSPLYAQIGDRPVWCAASTHKGEDELIIAAHKTVLAAHPKALLILVPRHPERGADVAALVNDAGLGCALRSADDTITAATRIYVMDTIGELGIAFRLSKLTVMCGSLKLGLSGHNPLEPARLGNAVLSGVHVSSFKDTYDAMFKSGAMPITNPNGLGDAISALFSAPPALKTAQKLAKEFADSQDGVLDVLWDRLAPIMPPRDKG